MAVKFNTLNKDSAIFKELSKVPFWWQQFKSDPNLYIEVRKDNQVNVYFEGGSVAKIHYCSKHKKLQVFTHHKYLGIPDSKPKYVECSKIIGENIEEILTRVKSCYSQKKRVDDRRMLKVSDDNPEVISQMNLYKKFIQENRDALLDYYQRLYLGLSIPETRPVDINTTPELLIFNRWVKTHPARTQHKERVEQILQRENIRYSITAEL